MKRDGYGMWPFCIFTLKIRNIGGILLMFGLCLIPLLRMLAITNSAYNGFNGLYVLNTLAYLLYFLYKHAMCYESAGN